MLDYFAIFTRGGALLWTLQFATLRHNPVEALNALICNILLEEKAGERTYTYVPKNGAHQMLKWTFDNKLGLVFVAVYQRALMYMLPYIDDLLERVKSEFGATYDSSRYKYDGFEEAFQRLLKESQKQQALKQAEESNSRSMGGKAQNGQVQRSARKMQTSKQGVSDESNEEDGDAARAETVAAPHENGMHSDPNSSDVMGDSAGSDGSGDGREATDETDKGFDKEKLKALAGKGVGPKGRRALKFPLLDKPKKNAFDSKKGRGRGEKEDEKLDFSVAGNGALDQAQEEYLGLNSTSKMDEEDEEFDFDVELEDVQLKKASSTDSVQEPKKKGLLASFMNSISLNVVGKQALTAADLEAPLAEMKKKLMERNVAEEIAQKICDSVCKSLEGQKLASFTGVSGFVKKSFEDALNGILNKRAVDVLVDIKKAKARGKPYVIVFCGVNGVGKSTNLAKIAYWLGQHKIKTLIAACDTFRAGAVEQLKTHCARLNVPLYERGYEKDPAKVAFEAVKQAERDGLDVVLVDTAGRMQDNEPLMRALSNLIHVNQPNLVLFVGEALVGNDAVDQLVKFNRALYDLAPASVTNKHLIDGIVLTKFDTIDDKVGAALSMVYCSGAPVMFVGCGQTYVDLKKLNVKSVVNSLLK